MTDTGLLRAYYTKSRPPMETSEYIFEISIHSENHIALPVKEFSLPSVIKSMKGHTLKVIELTVR